MNVIVYVYYLQTDSGFHQSLLCLQQDTQTCAFKSFGKSYRALSISIVIFQRINHFPDQMQTEAADLALR